jgi:hypothetical protein
MTNRDLLNTPRHHLSPRDRQRQHVLRVETTPVPCPVCRQPLDALTAAGIDVDQYDFGKSRHKYRCPHCRAELELVVPVISLGGPGWHWQIQHQWLSAVLEKARAHDREHPTQE